MRNLRVFCVGMFFLSFRLLNPGYAWEGIPLNDHERLGQRFLVPYPFVGVSVVVPSWLDAEGGLTLTLWDGPERTRQLAREVRQDIPDNAEVSLVLTESLPRGVYYWEVTERTGETRVGLYGMKKGEEDEQCAYFNGMPDCQWRFKFSTTPAPLFQGEERLQIAILKGSPSLQERKDACRQLAVVGGADSVPALADLLDDKGLHHPARNALQIMNNKAARTALRRSLDHLEGEWLVGSINSLGEMRDLRSVKPLAERLTELDPAVGSAAAEALGKIGTLGAFHTLRRAKVPQETQAAVWRGLLDCAGRLLDEGKRRPAERAYEKLLNEDVPLGIRRGALRGTLLAGGKDRIPLLLGCLESEEEAPREVALWLVQHELSGAEVTEKFAEALPGLPLGPRISLVRALCARGDPAALPQLAAQARRGEKEIRLAVLLEIVRFRDPVALRVLVDTLSDPDEEISEAARSSLVSWPGPEADAEAMSLLEEPREGEHLFAIQLARVRRLQEALPFLLQWAAEEDEDLSVAALEAFRDLAASGTIASEQMAKMVELWANAESETRLAALEKALIAALKGNPQAASHVDSLISRSSEADADRKKSLLRLLHAAGGKRAYAFVLDFVENEQGEVRATALKTLCEWQGLEAENDLFRLAKEAANPKDRLLCLRSCLRLAGREELPLERRVAICKKASTLTERDDEKRLLLGMLGDLGAQEALNLASSFLEDPGVREEAEAAVQRLEKNSP